jgi:TPR repeat protein
VIARAGVVVGTMLAISGALACAPASPPAVATANVEPPPVCPLGGCARAPAARAANVRPVRDDPAQTCDESSPSTCTERAMDVWEHERVGGASIVLPLFDRACNLGDARGCMFAGRIRLERAGHVEGGADEARRAELQLQKACDAAEPIACDALAQRTEPSMDERRRAYRTRSRRVDAYERLSLEASCWRGGSSSCFTLGLHAERGIRGFSRDLTLAARAYTRGCVAGEPVSCNNLANAVYYGDGVAQDFVRAARLYEKACAGGEPVGCANVGFIAEYGDGVPVDMKLAGEMYRSGCAGGSSYACLHVAMLAAYRKGVPHDPAKAVAAWQRACDERDATACAFLAIMHEDGKGVPRDEDRARELMRKACDRNEARACSWIREQAVN